ncbi:EspA/EspE family type VII secretion system effector [Mycobacterium kansasii]|uniref:EspA/EspE family type VII secretion system effector n=1 Tax=Mycobacterium kansasii TaxID=1768 RepID=UPI0011582596|nr:EspA/EspE family type VII secretion system effector [Mycobacterium kansasii]
MTAPMDPALIQFIQLEETIDTRTQQIHHLLNLTGEQAGEIGELTAEQNRQRVLQQARKELAEEWGRQWWGVAICVVTEVLLSGVQIGLGAGFPDRGDGLASGASMFSEVGDRIAALHAPDGGWQGSAARAYSVQNLAQSRRVQVMAELDRLAADMVSAQAQVVGNNRLVTSVAQGAVGATALYCLHLEQAAYVGLAAGNIAAALAGLRLSRTVALGVCGLALATVGGFLIDLAVRTSRNATELLVVTRRATDVLAALPSLSDPVPGVADVDIPRSDSPAGFDVPALTLPPSVASSPDVTAPLPGTPDAVGVFADLPGSPEFSGPTSPIPGFPDFGAPDMPIPVLAGLPDLSGGVAGLAGLGLANPPAVTKPPAMDQLRAALSRLTGLSGAAGGPSQLAGVDDQRAQMISLLAQQGVQPGASPADHVTNDDASAGAASGPTSAWRAPVDAATAPPNNPSSASRDATPARRVTVPRG